MKQTEYVYLRLLETPREGFTQLGLSRELKLSLATVNRALAPLRSMGAIHVNPRGFDIVDARKILYYWASVRRLNRDMVYSTRVEAPVNQIEAEMPGDVVYGAYTAYKMMFNDVPADYSEVYVYADELIVKKRFPESQKRPNVFVLKMDNCFVMTPAHIYVDLWNLKEWYAAEFLNAMEVKLDGILA